jgi:hypothetical protein
VETLRARERGENWKYCFASGNIESARERGENWKYCFGSGNIESERGDLRRELEILLPKGKH